MAWGRAWVWRDGRFAGVFAARTLDFTVLTDDSLFLVSTGFFTRRPRRRVYAITHDRLRVEEYLGKQAQAAAAEVRRAPAADARDARHRPQPGIRRRAVRPDLGRPARQPKRSVSSVIAIDAGTTGVRAFAVGADGRPLARSYREFPQHFPQPGWVEHDAEDIWRVTLETVGEVADLVRDAGEEIAAIGITNQRETVVVWDRTTGRPLAPAIVWQDRRTAERCDALARRGPRARRSAVSPGSCSTRTSRRPSSNGCCTKGALRASDPNLAFGTVDTWLLWKLTGGAARRRARDRSVEREPHDAVRHRAGHLVRRAVRPVRCAARVPARGDAVVGPVRHDRARTRGRIARPGERHRRRPTSRAVRAGVCRAGDDEEHVRHGLVRADQRRAQAPRAGRRPADDDRVVARARRR